MSDDEVLMTVASLVVATFFCIRWIYICTNLKQFGRGTGLHRLAMAMPFACAVAIFILLKLYASFDVRDAPEYLIQYTGMGLAWIAVCIFLANFLGLNLRDDWLERLNPAAAVAGCGVMVGALLTYTGANFGDGPGWLVVVFCAALATGAWFVCWLAYEKSGGIADKIAIDRDMPAAWRFTGFLVCNGVILGRAAAGNWTGADNAIQEFLQAGWPAIPVTIVAAVTEGLSQPRKASPFSGPAVAAVYTGVIAGYLYWAGPWS